MSQSLAEARKEAERVMRQIVAEIPDVDEALELADAMVAAALAEVAERDRWIPVGERLPETNTSVLVVTRGTGRPWVTIAEGAENVSGKFGAWRHAYEGWIMNDVTHWRPLPEPPGVKP